jgi:mRNA-degrading endonuclease toxin of MazEF toxin-antitoxin module
MKSSPIHIVWGRNPLMRRRGLTNALATIGSSARRDMVDRTDEPRGSEPGFRRPLLVLQANPFNRSRLRNPRRRRPHLDTRLLDAPGSVLIRAKNSGLPMDSAAHVTQIVTVARGYGRCPPLPISLRGQQPFLYYAAPCSTLCWPQP